MKRKLERDKMYRQIDKLRESTELSFTDNLQEDLREKQCEIEELNSKLQSLQRQEQELMNDISRH